jgi:hypothetical protein
LTGTITYTPSSQTNGNVTASISFNKPDVVVTNANGATYHLFTGNGTFTFTYRDPAGNT